MGCSFSVVGQYCRALKRPGSRASSIFGSIDASLANAPARRIISRVAATSGLSGTRFSRKLREDLAIERRMRLPRLRRYHSSFAHSLLVHEDCPGLLRFHAHMPI